MEAEAIEEEVSLFEDNGKPEEPAPKPETADPKEPEPKGFDVPDKFKDKSFEDVVQSYVQLEKMHGNTANEIGELRKLTDQLLMNQQSQQMNQYGQPADDIDDDVGIDDFFDDPSEAVAKAISKNPTLKKLEQTIEMQELQQQRSQLLEAHPDADTLVSTPEFQAWLDESPGRRDMLQQAHVQRNVGVATSMLDMYKATKQAANETASDERSATAKADLKKASVESGGGAANTRKVYRRAELIELKLRDPARYEAMKDEIYAAYAEGRVK